MSWSDYKLETPQPLWTLQDGLTFIRAHQDTFKALNYHIGLAGGVVNNGRSDKDLDVTVMSMCNQRPDDYSGLLALLRSTFACPGYTSYTYGLSSKRELYIGSYKGKRIDFFVYP